jgi:hypothetical protein
LRKNPKKPRKNHESITVDKIVKNPKKIPKNHESITRYKIDININITIILYIIMTTHECRFCNYSTNHKGDYDKHKMTQKHRKNTKGTDVIYNNGEQNNNLIVKIDKLAQQNEEVIKQNEKLRQEIEKLKQIGNQNTNKIVKEARSIKKSILTILNTNFKDTPSIDYIDESEFRNELEKEYKYKINDPENKLFMRIFSDYENKKLIQTLSNLILKFVKKEDQKNQSVFNIDSARGNYATKIEDIWHNDKSGLQLKKYTLDMVIKFILNVLDIFGQKIEQLNKEKNKTQEKMDYIMKYYGIFLEVRAYLTNINTHKKVILFICPELRLDQKMLESINY